MKSLLLNLAKLSVCTLLLGAGVAMAQFSENPVLSVETRKGVMVNIYSEIAPLDINKIHSWQLRLKDADGKPVSNANIELIGGMPEHDHGLPTQPQITAETEPGSYLLEGVRFHMPGKWQLDIKLSYTLDSSLDSKSTSDSATDAAITETAVIEFQL